MTTSFARARLASLRLALLLTLLAAPAFAADTTVTVPWGNWLGAAASFIASLTAALIAWGLRFLPEQIAAILLTIRVEQLLGNAINYGLNAVPGAARGKTLTFDVGNAVLAEALRYALERGPAALLAWLGGADKLRGMILARINLEESAALK